MFLFAYNFFSYREYCYSFPVFPSAQSHRELLMLFFGKKTHCQLHRSKARDILRDLQQLPCPDSCGEHPEGATQWKPYHPSLSAAFTFTPNCTRNFTISVCPAHTALCRAVIPSSLGMLGSSTWPARKEPVTFRWKPINTSSHTKISCYSEIWICDVFLGRTGARRIQPLPVSHHNSHLSLQSTFNSVAQRNRNLVTC